MIITHAYRNVLAGLLAACALALLVLAPAGAAADAPAEGPQGELVTPEAQAEAMEVSDEKLQQFLNAAISVQDVQREYVAEIQATEDTAEAETLRESAQEEMVSAVEDSGLTVLEFNLIAQRLQTDAELVQRLDDLQRQ